MNPIWNTEENRPKAVFRLCCQFLVFLLLDLPTRFLISRYSPTDLHSIPSSLISFTALTSMMVSVWIAGRFLDKRPFSDFGYHVDRTWRVDLIFGLLLGALLISLVFFIEIMLGWVIITDTLSINSNHTLSAGLLNSLILFTAVGIQEETFSRGYHLRNIAEGLSRPGIQSKQALLLSWVISSILFGLFHAGNPHASIVSTIIIIFAGLFFGLGYVLTGELAIPIGIHITWNFFQGTVFGFPVSGQSPILSLLTIHQAGPAFWTGGNFGPEAGILSLLVIMLGCAALLTWLQLTNRLLSPIDNLSVYQRYPVNN